jgi:hypothetical protein
MTEQEWKSLSVEDKIAITNIVIGVVRKSGHMCLNRPLRYFIRLTPEADLYVKEKKVAAAPEASYGFPHGAVSALNASGKCVTDGETSP